MKRNWVTILLLLCFAALMFGGVYLYRFLTEESPQQLSQAEPEDLREEASIAVSPDQPDEPSISVPEDDTVPSLPNEEKEELNPSPDFVMNDTEGNEIRLSDFYGKPIILNFWATWCGPCQAELPHFQAAFTKYQNEIQFVMLDLVDGYSETVDNCKDFLNTNGYTFPLFFDAKGEGALAYGISAIPCTVAIDSNGNIVAQRLGSMSSSDLQELLDLLLK